jgi:hypothetical protein
MTLVIILMRSKYLMDLLLLVVVVVEREIFNYFVVPLITGAARG